MGYRMNDARDNLVKAIGDAIDAKIVFTKAAAAPDNHTANSMQELSNEADWKLEQVGHRLSDYEDAMEREFKSNDPYRD